MVVCPAIACMTTAVFLIPRVESVGLLVVAAVSWGLSTGTMFPCIQALAFSSVQPHQRTSVASSLFNAFDVGIGFGSIALGVACERFETYRVAFTGAVINCLAFLVFYVLYYFILHPPTTAARPGQPPAGDRLLRKDVKTAAASPSRDQGAAPSAPSGRIGAPSGR
jgi:MFS family permease